MSIIPRPSKRGEPPPIVAYWGEAMRESRVGRWVRGHKALASAAAALLVVAKAWKWLIFDMVRWIVHPGRTAGWAVNHWMMALGLSVAVFVVAFVVTRLGLGRFDRGAGAQADGTAAAERMDRARREQAMRIPPRMG